MNTHRIWTTAIAGLMALSWVGVIPNAHADDTKGFTRYRVELPARPMRRVWCTFRDDGASQGDRTVTFDPSLSDALSQVIALPDGATWTVRCDAERVPVIVETKSETRSFDLSWILPSEWRPVRTTGKTLPVVQFRMGAGGKLACPLGTLEPPGTSANTDKAGTSGAEAVCNDALERMTSAITIRELDESAGQPKLADAARALSTGGGGAAGGRSLDDTVPALVSDTLTLLAEIAIERARGRAEALIIAPLTEIACGPEELSEWDAARAVLEKTFEKLEGVDGALLTRVIAPEHEPPLPRTCALVRNRTLAQIAETGAELADAFGLDLMHIGMRLASEVATQTLTQAGLQETGGFVRAALGHAEPLLARMLETHTPPSSTEAQLLLVALAGDAADQLEPACAPMSKTSKPDGTKTKASTSDASMSGEPARPADCRAMCAASLGFAVAGTCHAAGERCDARMIAELVRDRDQHFQLEQCEGVFGDAKGDLEWLPGWAARLVAVLSPPADETPRDQARRAIDLTFELIERAVVDPFVETAEKAKAEAKKAKAEAEETKAADIQKKKKAYEAAAKQADRARIVADHARLVAGLVDALHTLSLGIIDQDGSRTISGATAAAESLLSYAERHAGKAHSEAIQDMTHHLLRMVRVASALADNARSLELAKADPTQAESQRQARKQTLESLVEAMTDRRGRGGDWVASLGANVGGLLTPIPVGLNDDEDRLFSLNLSAGFAVQYLPRHWFGGIHTQLTLVDLGRMLVVEEDEKGDSALQWNDFVVVGFQLGLIIPPLPDDAFNISFDLRYLPTGRHAQNFQLGIVLGYYVPFLDFN